MGDIQVAGWFGREEKLLKEPTTKIESSWWISALLSVSLGCLLSALSSLLLT